ncbi:MAG: sulfotransferase [Halioglobus sp.]|nr:sulfotransferase [Halioglobus sp.]
MNALLASLSEAPLNDMGAGIMRSSIVHSLVNRLRLNYWLHHHPEILNESIQAPLVVVGMMRSGTTLVQRLLAADPGHTSTLGWEAMAPAPPPGSDPRAVEPRLAQALAREEQTRTFAPDLFAIHPTYADQAEEEIMFLADAFLSHVPEASCDLPAYRTWLNEQDFAPAYANLYRTLQLLQWQKRLRGEPCGRWVLKTPAHLGYLRELLDTFPGAHVVHLHRDPMETIPSGASLNTTLWRMHADDVDPTHVGAQWLDRMGWTNDRAIAFRRGLPREDQRFTDIRFSYLTRDPVQQVAVIYARAGIELTANARGAMQDWLRSDSERKLAQHSYAPEDFGLTTVKIRDRFSDYYQHFLESD